MNNNFDLGLPVERGESFEQICIKLGCDLNSSGWPDSFGRFLANVENKYPINTLSLFSGAGGLDIGFHDAGFDIIESVEIENKFCETILINTGEGKYFRTSKVKCLDVRNYKADNLPRIDFIIGGPPCQVFSAAGRRANGVLGTTDERGVLFREYVRLLGELQPRGFLFENVYGIIGAQNGAAWKEIVREFSCVGYTLYYRILDAADYGVPQHRERLIIVGVREGGKSFLFPRPTHGPDSVSGLSYYSASQAILGIDSEESGGISRIGGRYGRLLDDIPPGLNYSFYTEEMGHPNPVFAWRSKFSDFLYKADPSVPVRTIKAQGGQYTGPFHWENRKFSVVEIKRLQTFPDNYELAGNRQTQIQQVGNSVPPQFSRILAIAIREQIFGAVFPFKLSYLGKSETLGFRTRKRYLTKIYREKASAVIEKLSLHDKKRDIASIRSYCAILLKSNFSFIETNSVEADFSVHIEWKKECHVTVKSLKEKDIQRLEFTIIVEPIAGQWMLPVTRIVAKSYCSKLEAYTAVWKAIEIELIRHNIKADLVQLSGYYQYSPKLRCNLICEKFSLSFFSPVVRGDITRRMISEEELAEVWGIPAGMVIHYAEKLREAGYEVRNTSTNPQIEPGQWLIPYEFPTLGPLSVQLKKGLR